ncbi:unnamed protein product [Linum tenue]|uniref:Fatty acyl-CoA reductase n=1 Tax=Linum tenue TaxID=586396 RepID=A0AAV0R6R1_9ROSI|nr:unnamed protein product [Linum tenue]
MLLLEQKTVLVTGATGFLAKIFVEKILRIQPNVKKVLGKEVFRVLKEKWGAGFQSFISEKVVAVAGDVSSEDLGIEDLHLKEEILKETDLVLNFAAITKFDERAGYYGWPNTYTFTKAMAEMVMVDSKGDIPLVIIRPTMVTSTFQDPFPGWLEGVRTLDGFIVSYARGRLKCIVHRPDVILDLIPADIVVDATIGITAMALANQHVDLVYHLGSSSKNPIRLPEIHRLSKAFFAKDPWKNRQGKPVKAGKVTTFNSMASFHVYMAIRFQLPLKIMGLLSASCCHKLEADYVDLSRQLKSGMRLIQLYKSYLFFDGIFDDTNLEVLRKRARDQKGLYEVDGVEQLNMDIKSIDWKGYITNVHIPGLLQFVMKK